MCGLKEHDLTFLHLRNMPIGFQFLQVIDE